MAVRVLVVDDEQDFLDSIVMRLELRSIEVDGVGTGVAALDFGAVFNRYESGRDPGASFVTPGAWDSRTLTGVLGVNVLLGPILLRVHFGHPYDIDGLETPAMKYGDDWVTNITLRYFFW